MTAPKAKQIPVEIIFDFVLSQQKNKKEKFIERALDDFMSIVQPPEDFFDSDELQGYFLEWLLFDHPCRNYDSMIEHFLDYHMADIDESALDAFEQAAHTQFVGEFMIEKVFPFKNTLVMRDIHTDEIYEVVDESISRELEPGVKCFVSGRLFNADGIWQFAGNLVDVFPFEGKDPAFVEEFERAMVSDGVLPNFISLLWRRMEIEKRKRGESSERSGVSFPAFSVDAPESMKDARLAEMEMQVNKLHEDGLFVCDWNGFKEFIYEDDIHPISFSVVYDLMGKDESEELPLTDDVLHEIAQLLADSWNLLPLRSLDGISAYDANKQK